MEQGKAEQTVDLWTSDKFNYRPECNNMSLLVEFWKKQSKKISVEKVEEINR